MLESLLKLLAGESPDEIVWTADLTYWWAGRLHDGTLDDKYKGEEGLLRLSRDLGVVPYYWYEKFWLANPVYKGVEVLSEQQGKKTLRTWKTAVGCIEEVTMFAEESCSQACVKYPVQNRDDLEVLLHVLEHRSLDPDCLSDYDQRRELYREYDGIPVLAMPRSPLSALAVEWCGIQNLVYLMSDHPEMIKRAMEMLEQQEEPILEAVCRAHPPLVHFADNLTSEFYTPYFDEFMAERYRRRLNRLHAAGIKCAVHLDGTIKGLLPKLAGVGIDAVEALTPAPVGDVELKDMRELAGSDTVILWGGLPGAMFTEPYTWDDMKNQLLTLLECWENTPFVIGVADQVPVNGDISFCEKISELVKSR